jgi:hypothetical protein
MNLSRVAPIAGVVLLFAHPAYPNTNQNSTETIETSTRETISPHINVYNGTPITQTLQFVVTPQVIASGACSAVIYNANWVIGSADCIAAALDTNGDGVLLGSEIPAGSYIWNGNPATNYVDMVVKHREATFGSTSGSNIVMYHVTAPFDIPWLIANRGAGYYYTNNVLNLFTSSTLVTSGTLLGSWGYGATTFPYLGYGSPQLVTDYGSWYTTQPYNNAGTPCTGDAGGPDFYWTGSQIQWLGLHSVNGGWCGSVASNVASRYVATWIQHIAGTLQ